MGNNSTLGTAKPGTPASGRTLEQTIAKTVGYVTVFFTLAMLFFFLVYPVSVIMAKAFITGNGELTLSYFQLLFANNLYTAGIVNSLWIGFFTTLFCGLLALPLSWVNVRWEFPGKPFLMGLLLVPMVMPPFVGAIGVQRFFAQYGSINLLLREWELIDRPIEWLAHGNKFWAVVILLVLHLYPIMYLNLSAALANIDPSLEEAASTLGVPKWRQQLQIMWPLAMPGFFAGAIIVFIWALTDLGTPLLVGYEDVMPVSIFRMVTDVNANPVGYALVFIVILLTVAIFVGSKFMFNRKKIEMMGRGHVSSAVQRAAWPQLIVFYPLILGVVAIALFPHVSVFITSISHKWFMTPLPEQFTLQYYEMILQMPLPWSGIKNSFFPFFRTTGRSGRSFD